MKRVVLASAVLSLGMSSFLVFAEGGHDHHDHMNMQSEKSDMKHPESSDVINVGNKICPVSDEVIGSMGDAHVVEYEGKSYNLCCKMCAKDFKKNPEKYIEKINAELDGSGSNLDSGHGGAHSGHDHGSH